MNRRTFEGPMDWEYQDKGPVDLSSPFAQVSQKPFMASFDTSSPTRIGRMPNPFAAAAAASAPSPSKQQQQQHLPPNSSIFNPQVQRQFTGPSFRNPAFTTPQKRVEDLVFSECSGAEESPALTDASEMPSDTPELDRSDGFGAGTITPASMNKTLFNRPGSVRSRTPGRGEVPRGKADTIHRDRVRKRKRIFGDKDVGSVRSRLPRDSGDSDSEWEETSRRSRSPRKKQQQASRGWISGLFTAIHDHPSVPLILSWWVQLSINVFIVSIFMWLVWSVISMMRADIANATDAARARLLAEMEACAHEYTKNRCAPKSARLPALGMVCDEWEACMNQDPSSVMKLQVSAKNVAEIINEFVGVMSIKAWGFILSTLLIMILANNIGFSRFRENAYSNNQTKAAHPFPSQAAGPPMLSSSQDPNQAYIWAPIGQTPRRVRRDFFLNDATDTDASPSDTKAILAPQTPSFRRSPSKGERGRSPTKYGRSPSKEY